MSCDEAGLVWDFGIVMKEGGSGRFDGGGPKAPGKKNGAHTGGLGQNRQASIGTLWVDAGEIDKKRPRDGSGLSGEVGKKKINTDQRECLCAATSPLEAKKVLPALAVTAGIGQRGEVVDEGRRH